MKKLLFILITVFAIFAFVSCATKAPAEEAPAAEPEQEAAEEKEIPGALIHFELSEDGKALIVYVQCHPEEELYWNPIYETEADAQKIVWLEDQHAIGTYKFDEAETELDAQRHIFEAAAPAIGLEFGLAYKQSGVKVGELLIVVNISENLEIEVVRINGGLI